MSSTHTLGGMVLGLAIGAGAYYAVSTFVFTPADACADRCGEGTACEAGRCVVAVADEPDALEPAEDEGDGKRRRRRRGKRRGSRGGDGGDSPAAGGGPPVDDDSHVPRFNANADQTISMADGTGRLSDSQIDGQLAKLDPAFQRCIRDASARVDALGSGTVRYSFGVDGKGKVTGVTASAPGNLADAGVVPCVRKAIHAHRFPAFDGPTMKVKSSFRVD